ncbi:MAG: HRDC domain-containing protein [Planctomycetota bacterium]|nr:HRDC domain-containing protein [Planctomycetota bacterium]
MNLNYRRKKRERHHAASQDDDTTSTPHLEHSLVPRGEARLITTTADLEAEIAHVREKGVFAYDTEFIGEESYWPKICVVQLATTERVVLVDAFAVPDLKPILELVADPTILTIVHAGTQDLEPVRRLLGKEPANTLDVQVAAAFAEMPWPAGLEKLVERFAGHKLSKGHTFTNWDARPLSASQLRYAADDVRYLPLVWERLRAELERRGTLAWAMRECEQSSKIPARFDEESQIRRTMKSWPMKPAQIPTLRLMTRLRDEIARKEDLPHRVVMPDETLAEIVRQRPVSVQQLSSVRGLPKRFAQKYGDVIAQAVDEGGKMPPEKLAHGKVTEETGADRAAIDAIVAILGARCMAMGLAPAMVATRGDISRWWMSRATQSPQALFEPGDWRVDAVGNWVESFLRGEASVSIAWKDGRPTLASERGA